MQSLQRNFLWVFNDKFNNKYFVKIRYQLIHTHTVYVSLCINTYVSLWFIVAHSMFINNLPGHVHVVSYYQRQLIPSVKLI